MNKDKYSKSTTSKNRKRKLKKADYVTITLSDDSLSCEEDMLNFTSGKHTSVELLHSSNKVSYDKSLKEQKPVCKGQERYSKQFPKPRLSGQSFANIGITLINDKKYCETKLRSINKNQNNDHDFHSTNFTDLSYKKRGKKYHRTQIKNNSENYIPYIKQNKGKKRIRKDDMFKCVKKTIDASSHISSERNTNDEFCSTDNIENMSKIKKSQKSSQIYEKNIKSAELQFTNKYNTNSCTKNKKLVIINNSIKKDLKEINKINRFIKKKNKTKKVNKGNKITHVLLSDDETDTNMHMSDSQNKNYDFINNATIKELNNASSKKNELKNFAACDKKNKELGVLGVTKKHRKNLQFKSDYYKMTNKDLLSTCDYYTSNHSAKECKKRHKTVVRYGPLYENSSSNAEIGKIAQIPILHKIRIKNNENDMGKAMPRKVNSFHVDKGSNKVFPCDSNNIISTKTKINIHEVDEPVLCIKLSDDESCLNLDDSRYINMEIDSDFNKRKNSQKCDKNCISNETTLRPPTPTLSDYSYSKDYSKFLINSNDSPGFNSNDKFKVRPNLASLKKLKIKKKLTDSNDCIIVSDDSCDREKVKSSPFTKYSKENHDLKSETIRKNSILRSNTLCSDSSSNDENEKNLMPLRDCIIVSDDSCDHEKAKSSPITKSGKENHDLRSKTIRKNSSILRCNTLCSDSSINDEKENNLMPSHDCKKLNNCNNISNEVNNSSREKINLNFLREFLEPDPVDFPVPLLHVRESCRRLSVAEINKIRSKGIKVRTGKFTKEEDTILKQNWQKIVAKYSLLQKPVCMLGIGSGRPRKQNLDFIKAKHIYLRLAHGLDDRPLNCIYNRARRLFHPARNLDKLTNKEISKIKNLQKVLGNNWNKIGEIIGRPPYACMGAYDWWHKTEIQRGLWSSKESQILYDAVKLLTKEGQRENSYGFWEKVSSFVATRNSIQCRKHWLNKYCWKVVTKERRKWSKQDYARLVCLLKKNIADNETEVDWKYVSNSFVHCSPSYFNVQRRWFYLKSLVPKDEAVSLQKTVDYLYFTYVPQILGNICMEEFQDSC